jgi:hypothetical protein
MASLPVVLWGRRWVAPTFPESKIIPMADLKSVAFREATEGYNVEKFELRGLDVRELAKDFLDTLAEAARRGDFTSVLSPQRDFVMWVNNLKTLQFIYLLTFSISSVRHAASGWDGIQSMGEGIEREVLQTAFQEFQDRPAIWFLQRQDTHSSLMTLGLQRRQGSSITERSIKLSVLGALTSLLLLNGVPPIPLSPVLLHYFIHNLELDSISPDLLGNWYPDLGRLIQDWIAAGPNGDIEAFAGHFITYHDTQVSHRMIFITFILFLVQISSLASRDEATHQLLACEMLYRAIVGPAPAEHPDIQAFLQGFQLPCHNGYRFTDVGVSYVILPSPSQSCLSSQFIKRVEGGSEMLLSVLWTSNITSPTDLISCLHIRASPEVKHQLAAAVLDDLMTFSFIIEQFLQCTGVLCPL